ncbi:MAG TPA: hypothetical protein VH419_08970, partial [Nocardioidaceae bacterium]
CDALIEGRNEGWVEVDKQVEWLSAYVEKCMVEAWGDHAEELGRHGDVVTYRAGTASGRVQVECETPVIVRVMAKAVTGVRPTAKLLREINRVNACSRIAHLWWHHGDVVVECPLYAEAVTPDSLRETCFHVSAVANDIGVVFAALFDGATPFPPLANDSEDAA